MTNKLYLKADFHSHPLGDRYYPGIPTTLTEQDKNSIASFLHAMAKTELDVLACTDHNTILSGLWAKEVAERDGLPLIVIPGAEFNVWGSSQRIHLLALNIKTNLPAGQLPINAAIKEIHSQGGVAILAHPVKYPHEVIINPDIFLLLDGIETINVSEGTFPVESFLDQDSCYKDRFVLQTTGSDFHWEPKSSAIGKKPHPNFQIPVCWLLEKGLISAQDLQRLG